MPHHAATRFGSLPGTQTLNNFISRTELLIPTHYFDARPAIGIHEYTGGAQHAQQIGFIQHAIDHLLLLVHALGNAVRLRPLGFPGVEVFITRSDRAVIGFHAAAAYHQHIAVKQTRLALFQTLLMGGLALVAIALQLLKSFRHRVGAGRPAFFAFHHCQRDAIHEQHNIGNNELLHAARRVDAKLIDSEKMIVLRVHKVDQLHHRVLLAIHLVHIYLRLEQQLLYRLIRLQQGAVWLAQNLILQILNLFCREPLLALGAGVQRHHRLGEYLRQQPLAKIEAQAFGRIGRNILPLVDHLPAQCCKLLQEGLLDFRVFAHCAPSLRFAFTQSRP